MPDPTDAFPPDGARSDAIPVDRVVLFSDAVVAIAISLLILPLVDLVSEGTTVRELFDDHGGQLVAFGLSFAVIAQYWVSHHELFRSVDRLTRPIMWVNLLWLATIVFLPLPTEMLGNDSHGDRGVQAFYLCAILAASVSLDILAIMVRRIARQDGGEARVSFAETILIAAALLVAMASPAIGMWSMTLLFLTPALSRLLGRFGLGS